MKYRLMSTAGHVDHGKTTLLKSLTGQDADRLEEEKERGLTIDLGFADMRNSEVHIGFVDVPGHQNFIKNMVSGIGSVQGVLFVVSATDGWQEQSREHFEIVNLISPEYCCFAITKIDKADDDMRKIVKSELKDATRGTKFADSPIHFVSGETDEGVESLRKRLLTDIGGCSDPRDESKPYCPVDRTFSVKGQGTVLTGSLSDGQIAVDDEIVLMPDKRTGRVRGLHQYHTEVERAHPGSRVAINVPEWSPDEVTRGQTVTVENAGLRTQTADGILRSSRHLPTRITHDSQVLAYLGTTRETVQLLLESEYISAGQEQYARIKWVDNGVFTRPGDSVILRDFSDRHLLGCLTVLEPSPDRYLTDSENLEFLSTSFPVTVENIVKAHLTKKSYFNLNNVATTTSFSESRFMEEIDTTESILLLNSKWVVKARWWEKTKRELRDEIETFHDENPLSKGVPLNHAREIIENDELIDMLIAELTDGPYQVDGTRIRHQNFSPSLSEKQQAKVDNFLDSLEMDGLETPDREQLVDEVGESVLQYLIDTDELIMLDSERIISAQAYERLVAEVRSYMEKNQPCRLSELRDCLDSSRKYVIPFMEYLDRAGITVRDDDVRYLRD